jgi:UDP-N-acetylmuramate--alanine ligase
VTNIVKNKPQSITDSVLLPTEEIYGVIGICGIVGNLTARVLMDHGHTVIGNDLRNPDDCKFLYTLNGYETHIFFSGHPESFFKSSSYIIPPPSLPRESDLFQKIMKYRKLLEIDDLLKLILPRKPVICITGTNGKTTTTSLLKHFCYESGLRPTEHGFKTLQGNVDYIPPLQCRLNGDVAVLETGTGGNPGDLKFIVERCHPTGGIITNITPDHLNEEQNFLIYARIKAELLEELQHEKVVVNGDDPTVWGLIEETRFQGEVVTFGVEMEPQAESHKICWCGRELIIHETISGVGYYHCQCGLKRPEPDYMATDIKRNSFVLHASGETLKIEMGIYGLHNVYNALAAIAAATELLKIPLEDLQNYLKTFTGVPGRLEYVQCGQKMDVIVDFAHNPSGVETVLREVHKSYNRVAVIITTSSESGPKGDLDIIKSALKNADYIIPASYHSRQAAGKYISHTKIILTDKEPEKFREGTLGATPEQLIEGLKKGLKCNADALLCIGEAAIKYKDNIKQFTDSQRSSR